MTSRVGTPAHFLGLVRVEIQAIFGRASGRAALALAAVVGVGACLALQQAQDLAQNMTTGGVPAGQLLTADLPSALGWALNGRNLFVLPLMLVLSAAATLAGELSDFTLREALVRPVSRAQVILAKLLALTALSTSSLLITLVAALGVGAALFGASGELGPVLLGFALSLPSDIGLLCMTLLAASLVRSVGGVVVMLALYLLADKAVGAGLGLLANFGVAWAGQVRPYLPGTSLGLWADYAEELDPHKALGLLLLTGLTLGGTLLRLKRMDVP